MDHKIQNNGQTTSSNPQLVPLKTSLETTKIISLESNQITLQKCPLIVERDLTEEVAIWICWYFLNVCEMYYIWCYGGNICSKVLINQLGLGLYIF